ncbi:DUF4097 family beta strand repeat-containing protein [Nocardioides ferulae]|uniref:DUF4097 family beta strand repeat-containing protein n=1 Tax=Nocardioides ferulae TaxID=2340821 RepID=UPI000EB45A23|nr:DUF4097 family beta strand repeat-containing protein [Nocardioides ferulae]
MPTHSFATPEPILLSVDIGRGRVVVTASDSATDTGETTVHIEGRDAESVPVTQSGREITVVAPRRTGIFSGESALQVEALVPAGSDVELRTGSADIETHGPLAQVRAKSGSGRIEVDTAEGALIVVTGSGDVRVSEARGELRAKSGSGDIVVGSVGDSLVVSSGSGDVRVGHAAGPVVVKTGSGDLAVDDADGDLTWTTGSGDLAVGAVRRGRVSAKGASGDIRVGVPAGVPVWTDISTVSGEIRSHLPSTGQPTEGQDHVELRARTVSGDVLLVQA